MYEAIESGPDRARMLSNFLAFLSLHPEIVFLLRIERTRVLDFIHSVNRSNKEMRMAG